MKTNHTTTTVGAATRKWTALGSIILAASGLAGLTSCGTTSPRTQPVAGRAIIDAIPAKKHRDRIKGTGIVSVNGRSATRGEAVLPSGYNDVKVRYSWPQGGAQEVSLKFNARQNQRYFVKYDPFPPTADQFRGTTGTGNAASALFGMAGQMDIAGVLLVPPVVILGTADYAYRIKETIREHGEAAQYVDVFVISEDNAEGVVRRVRAYADGRVDSKRWDAWSNAPAGSPRTRGTTLRNREHAEVDPGIIPRD